MYEYTRLSVSFTRLNALDKAPFGDSKKERDLGRAVQYHHCARAIGLFCISWHIDMQRLTDPESGEGETLEASGWPDLAKQTKREWPTFENVFDGALAETPTQTWMTDGL